MRWRQIPKYNKQISNKSQIQIFNDPNGLEFDLLIIEIYLDFVIWRLEF
jgi:hypothetical protein